MCPVFPHCAFDSKNAADMGLMLHYNMLWNILHYPAGVLPITRVQPHEDKNAFEDDNYNDSWTKALNESANDSINMPIAV